MKTFLIAAGLAAAVFGISGPVAAQDMRPNASQPGSNDQGRRDRGTDGNTSRGDQQIDRSRDGRGRRGGMTDNSMSRGDRRMSRGYDRRSGWNKRGCHNVRRYHRWVRVCSTRR